MKRNSSRQITLIFDIFRIGVMTGYRGGMLNLYSVYSDSNVSRLCALLCPAISFLHFHVLQFHALHIGPSISRPSFSRTAFSAPPPRVLSAPAVAEAVNTYTDHQQSEQADDHTGRRDDDHQVGCSQWSLVVACQPSCRGLLPVLS